MTFSEFAQRLYPFCGDGKTPSDFVVALIRSIIEDTEDSRPLLDFKPDYLKRIYNGKKSISQQNATFVLSHLDKGAFATFISDRPDDAVNGICTALEELGVGVSKYEVGSVCADLFAEILTACASADKLGRSSSDMEIAAELSPDLARLRILLAKLPHPETLTPPDELAEDELPYVTELLAAYADAEGLDELTKDELKQLVLDGLVTVVVKQNGFAHSITPAGSSYCAKFENEYAASYRIMAQRTWELVSQKSERAVIELINRHSVSSVKRGEMNG